MTLACNARAGIRALRPSSPGLVAAAALAAGLAASPPSAQALPPEYLANAAFHPTDPNTMLVRYESGGGGLLISRDGAKTFRAYPAYAFYKYGLVDRVPVSVSGDGKIQVALSDGYFEDDGTGCSLKLAQKDNLGQSWIADIAQHPTNPDISFVVNTAAAYDAKHVGLWRRDKAGAFTPLGKSEPAMPMMNSVIVRGLAVVPRAASTDGLRFVQTVTRQTYDGGATSPTTSSALRYSDDLAATWTELPIPDPDKTNAVVRLLAVSASEPMKVVVSLDVHTGPDDGKDTVLLSVDGGMNFTSYSKELTAASQALVLPGGQLLLGDSGSPGGLWHADSIGAPLRRVLDDSVKCLAQQPGQGGKVFLCKGYEVGILDVAQGKFCGTFQMSDALGLVQCTGAADLTTNMDAKNQLCNAWCGPLHYSFSPLCAMYNDPAKQCGLVARSYDTDSKWAEPPGDFAAARCPGYERTAAGGGGDAGVATDAGANPGDAGSSADASTSADAGGGSVDDAGSASGSDDDEDAGEDAPKKKSSGCHVAAPGSAEGAGLSLALGLLSLLVWRRRRDG